MEQVCWLMHRQLLLRTKIRKEALRCRVDYRGRSNNLGEEGKINHHTAAMDAVSPPIGPNNQLGRHKTLRRPLSELPRSVRLRRGALLAAARTPRWQRKHRPRVDPVQRVGGRRQVPHPEGPSGARNAGQHVLDHRRGRRRQREKGRRWQEDRAEGAAAQGSIYSINSSVLTEDVEMLEVEMVYNIHHV